MTASISDLQEMAYQSRTKGTHRREVDFAVAVQVFLESIAKTECPECARRKAADAARVAKHRAKTAK